MVIVYQNGSRNSVNLYPSMVEVMTVYVNQYNDAMYRLGCIMAKNLEEHVMHQFRRKWDMDYGVNIGKQYHSSTRSLQDCWVDTDTGKVI